VGLPDAWRDDTGYLFDSREEIDQLHEYRIDLSHPQTRFGVLMRLAAWMGGDPSRIQSLWLEWRGSHGWELSAQWRRPAPRMNDRFDGMMWRVETEPPGPLYPFPEGNKPIEPEEALQIAVERIGRDHAIRRALGEEPQPGTLAEFGLMQPHEQWWRFDARKHGGAFIEWDRDGKFIGSAECGKRAPLLLPLEGVSDPFEALRALYQEVVDVP
jgi:hypothetical protein